MRTIRQEATWMKESLKVGCRAFELFDLNQIMSNSNQVKSCDVDGIFLCRAYDSKIFPNGAQGVWTLEGLFLEQDLILTVVIFWRTAWSWKEERFIIQWPGLAALVVLNKTRTRAGRPHRPPSLPLTGQVRRRATLVHVHRDINHKANHLKKVPSSKDQH